MSTIQKAASLVSQYKKAVEGYLRLQNSGQSESKLNKQWAKVTRIAKQIERIAL